MAHINLLPWREWERERKQKEFLVNLVAVLFLGAALVFAGGWYLDDSTERQNERNQFLTQKIAVLDERIAEIRNLRSQREELIARMRVIQDLQGNRPLIVRVFDELVRTLSSGVHFRSLKKEGTNFSVAGTAESNNRISSLMRNLDDSDWFAEPNLKSIKEDPKNSDYGSKASTFDLTFSQTSPVRPEEASEG
ncbi:MAG: PilN domain-containing protein [Gammaproteobacteria bacterium]|nr:PilN domain-containing protein [Gammaproteobacteria bacterium]